MRLDVEAVLVYSSPNLAIVGHVKNVLEMNGIRCEVRGQYLGAAAGEMPPIECWSELWVRDESRADEARKIIEEALGDDEESQPGWDCPGCGEAIEGQFAVCWNCGASHPQTEP